MTTALTIVALFFIHLAGQSAEPFFVWPVYALWAGLGLWALPKLRTVGGPVILALAAVMVAGALGGVDPAYGYRRWATIIGYGATYYWLAGRRPKLFYPALAIAGAGMSLMVVGGWTLGNPNIVAGFIYLSVPAALGAWRDPRRWYTLAVGAVALALTGSQGAWIAAAVAALVYTRCWRLLAAVLGAAPGLAVAQAVWHPWSIADRLSMWSQGLADLAPLGRGLGAAIYTIPSGVEHYHAHCLPLTVAVELGLPGLAALGWGVWRLVPRLTRSWQGATLAGLLAWSLIDEVVWFWGAGVLAMFLLSEVMRDE